MREEEIMDGIMEEDERRLTKLKYKALKETLKQVDIIDAFKACGWVEVSDECDGD